MKSPAMPSMTANDTSRLLAQWGKGDETALGRLIPAVYGELRQLASGFLRREHPGHTLETSALIHEAFLRLLGQDPVRCQDRKHFYAIAARTMRRILVEHARGRKNLKRGGGARRLSLDQVPPFAVSLDPVLEQLDDALDELAVVSPQQAQVVELRYFGGLRAEEISEMLDLSVPTVTRRWRAARAWLYRYLENG